MRFTIERIRALVLGAGALLILAILGFLVFDKFKNPLSRRDIPKRLGIEIQQEANGVTYTQAHGGNTIFKIHASRVVQLRNQHATLHDVQIELYGQHGRGVDTIRGDEFDYDQKTGLATASGPVEISLQRPAAGAAESKASNVIEVHTSGLTFEQKTGIATTKQRVEFSSGQGSGSSIGASFDSEHGLLVLDRDVELTAVPNSRKKAESARVHASHAEFERDAQLCRLTEATAETRTEKAWAARAVLYFRDDGSVERLNAEGGFTLATDAGSRVAAPSAALEFNSQNQPQKGHLSGGVTLASDSPGRTMSGAAPLMDLAFTSAGELRDIHLAEGVDLRSQEQGQTIAAGHSVPVALTRAWHSQTAEIEFRTIAPGKVEPAHLHGAGNVVLTAETKRGSEPAVPSRMAADELSGEFGPGSELRSVAGSGNVHLQQTSGSGTRQSATAERLQARFAPASAARTADAKAAALPSAQIETADLDGDVTLTSQPPAKAGSQAQPAMQATAGHALYEGAEQTLHLTIHPRVNDGGMEMSADTLDVSQQSGNAFARGNVKATWIESANAPHPAVSFGGRGPAHVVASEAELHQATGEAIFRGHARLWQDDNSVSAPVIVLDRQRQTLTARTANAAEPVLAVLLNASEGRARPSALPPGATSVIRVRGGELFYSNSGREAVFHSAPLATVTAQSGAVTSTSDQVELVLAPAGARRTPGAAGAPAQVKTMTASGHVVLSANGRRGSGQQLAYSADTGNYVLTGTESEPPRLSDPAHGSVTGAALIFHSRDDSVSIEGGQQETTTRTTAPR